MPSFFQFFVFSSQLSKYYFVEGNHLKALFILIFATFLASPYLNFVRYAFLMHIARSAYSTYIVLLSIYLYISPALQAFHYEFWLMNRSAFRYLISEFHVTVAILIKFNWFSAIWTMVFLLPPTQSTVFTKLMWTAKTCFLILIHFIKTDAALLFSDSHDKICTFSSIWWGKIEAGSLFFSSLRRHSLI